MLPTKFWWQPFLLTDRDEMSNFHRGHPIDDSYQVSVVAMFVNRSGRKDAKGNMSFFHHLMSVVCHPFTFHILIFSLAK
jgi:hypothetical protein